MVRPDAAKPSLDGPSAIELTPGKPIDRVHLSHHTHVRLNLRNRCFEELNANKAVFISCDFSYSIFHRAYFHAAKFENCIFTGCRFYDSNLRGASFYGCDLKYATFHRTMVEPREIIATLPLEPNLRRDSLQNLRANAAETGDYGCQRIYVLEEIRATEDHLRRALRGTESYYQQKYGTFLEKARAGLTLLGLRLGGWVWGHGERPLRILGSAIILIIILSMINLWAVVPRVGWQETDSGWEVLRYSVDTVLDFQPQQRFGGFLAVDYALVAMRYIYVGLFISVLFKSISHR